MIVKLVEIATLRSTALLVAFGCLTTVILSYPSLAKWWQEADGSAPVVSPIDLCIRPVGCSGAESVPLKKCHFSGGI